MKINRLHQIHRGIQPTRVLEQNILHIFENTHEGFLEHLKKAIIDKGLKPGLRYYCLEEALIFENDDFEDQTPFVGEDKVIVIHETFLSFLWIYCYTILVVFDEGIQKPLLDKTYDPNKALPPVATEALELFDYALTLIHTYTKWDKSKPNPEEYEEKDAFYIELANSVFLYALNTILCHELAHVALGHVDDSIEARKNKSYIPASQIKDDEYAADKYAIELMLRGRENPVYKKTIEFGLIAGFTSMIFLSNTLTSETHPDGDERIRIALEHLEIEENDNLWGIACFALRLWTNKNEIQLNWPNSTDTYKSLFYLTLDNLEKEK